MKDRIPDRRLLGVVLCGGQSKRMGTDKALLRCADGRTFLECAIDRLEPVCAAVVLSGATKSSRPIPVLCDPDDYPAERRGPVVGIVRSLRHAAANNYTACLITPVDTPWLARGDLDRLTRSWCCHNQLTFARSDRVEPLIGVYPIDAMDSLEKLSRSSDRSLLRWIETQSYTPVSCSAESCRNVNSPEDLES